MRSLRGETKDWKALAGEDDVVKLDGDGVTMEADELSSTDYTPARKKPPIHN